MIRTGFHYRVEAVVDFTGHDLAVMAMLASRHYDGVCKKTFACGGFGYGWLMHFLAATEDDSLSLVDLDPNSLTPELAARTLEVVVTSREIDTLRKILEAAQFSPLSDEHTAVAAKLMMGFGQVFREMNDESRRLHGRDKETA